ncbi:MAG TPA: bifunctional phosphoribosylaminoimidazolecarboxamide formyltransferase/IMP cyclohydrolase [Candidatus Limnocylindrales bacterium]
MAERGARIAVAVSGQGSNLRALVAAARRGELGGNVVNVVADRPCPAIEWAAAEGIATDLVAGGDDPRVLAALEAADADVVVLAGYLRIVGPRVLERYAGRILNTHPSLLPAFPGAHAVDDALRAGVRVTGCTVHLVTAELDGGPIVLQAPVIVAEADDAASLRARIQATEHRLLPRATALLIAGAIVTDGERVRIDHGVADARLPAVRRALLSVSDKTGLVDLAQGLAASMFELVSTGGTARTLRDAGLPVTDVAAVTGQPEMLDGRVKSLHPAIHGGILADRRRAAHRLALSEALVAPFELVVVNLYPFAAAAERPGASLDELIEEIDIGGPTLVRAAAKNHASVGILTDPVDYPAVLGELQADGRLSGTTRARLALAAFRHTAAYDARIAAELGRRFDVPAEATAPARLDLGLVKVMDLRYGENPHQAAAVYRQPDADPASGPFATGIDVRGGKALSYNNLLDASAAAGLARDLRGPACVIVKHGNPCGAAEASDAVAAWRAALAGDPVSAYGGVVALTRPIDAVLAQHLASIFLEVVVAPGIDDEAAAHLATERPGLRIIVDRHLGTPPIGARVLRSAGGAVLETDADTEPDDPAAWATATSRPPTDDERRDLDLAWRVARHVASNAIVLVRDGAVVGVGAGQMSRVDSARLACAKAAERSAGAVCASDAFFPFPDAVETCLAAGVGAFVQPGGSQRDAAVIGAADAAGATMLITGRRHFRH